MTCSVGYILTSQALARRDLGTDSIPGRSQRAQRGAAVPARGMVQEVQVDDQPSGSPAQVGALGGVERVPAAAVARLARGPVAQRPEQGAGILPSPPPG